MRNRAEKHFLLDKRATWRAMALDRVALVDSGNCLCLQPLPHTVRPLVDEVGSFGGLSLPTGLAVDDRGRIYILDTKGHLIKRFDPCTKVFEPLPCVGGRGSNPRLLCEPHGIAVSHRGDLYVADSGNRRVQIFALKGLSLRSIWGPLRVIRDEGEIKVESVKPEFPSEIAPDECLSEPSFPEETWRPWDIALCSKQWAFISDYENGLIHVVDSSGRWLKAFDGMGPDTPPMVKPTHLALDRDDRLYVVQEGRDYVLVLDTDGNFLEKVELADQTVKGRFCPLAIAVDEDGVLYISGHPSRRIRLYVRGVDGCYAYSGECRGYEGMIKALAFDLAGNPILADSGQGHVVRLEAKTAFEMEGRYWSEPLDSRIYRCQWHRIELDACIEPGTQIQVDTFTSESPKPAAEVKNLPEERWSTGQIHSQVGEGRWDCLIQSPPGRYLWLRLTLTGNGKSTLLVNKIKVYYPRRSSLQYLPGVYQEDVVSRGFLDRFLSIFDTVTGDIADLITDIARYFDPTSTPADGGIPGEIDFLTWLASWLDLTLDRHWPIEKRRELLRNAHRLYALRGTSDGLRLHIQLYTGLPPRILEHFKLRRWLYLDSTRLGDESELWGKAIVRRLQLDEYSQISSFQLIDSGDPLHDPFHHYAHQFTVYVPLDRCVGDTQNQTLARIVEMAKPAHTQGHVRIVEPRLRVGVQAFVGVDTIIGEYPAVVVTDEGRLSYDTVLGPSPDEADPPTLRIGKRSRIGSSTLVD